MSNRTKVILVAVGILAMVGLLFLCSAMFRGNAAPAPQTTVTPVVQETEDCDDDDRAKRQVEECGIGVLIDPRKSTKPVATTKPVAPVQTRCTRTTTRRC